MTTHPTDAEIAEIERSPGRTTTRTLDILCAAARDRNRLEAENAKLREVLEDVVDTLEAMDMHTDNSLYERVRAQLETDNG